MFKRFVNFIPFALCITYMSAMTQAVQTSTNGNVATHTHANDFISSLASPLPSLPTDKNTLIQKLDEFAKDLTTPHF